jgi:hypothetical protein
MAHCRGAETKVPEDHLWGRFRRTASRRRCRTVM